MIFVKIFFSKPKTLGYRICLLILCVCCAVFISFSIAACIRLAEQSSSIPASKKSTIILDAGHGGEDGGTTSKSGILEKDINLSVTLKLSEFLRASGFEVILIRDSDISVGNANLKTVKERKSSDLKQRLQIIKEHPDAIFVSIHQNHFEQSQYHGTQVFYSSNHEDGQLLAEDIQTRVVSLIQPDNTRVPKAAEKSIYLLWNSPIPSVIVECGFLSNEQEAQKLTQESYQKQMAFSIFCGILAFEKERSSIHFVPETSSEIE